MLDVRRLRVLREVAARGSFSGAADALSYTQSAISQQIAALEREAGATLLERGSRGVRLTDAGAILVRHAEAILARLADAERELAALAGLAGGTLRLSSFPTAGATIMPRAIAAFRRRHPAVEVSLAQAEPDEGMAGLRAGDWEIALSIEAAEAGCPLPDGVDVVHLLDDPMYVVLPVDHPLAGRARVALEELADEPWMLGTTTSCPDSRVHQRACRQAGFEPDIAFQSDDYAAIQGFVAAGVGVALVPDLALTSVREDVVVRSLGPGAPVRSIVATTLAGGYRSPAAAAMLALLPEVAAGFRADRGRLAVVA